jgi:pimeloyl-ACP methyl ester carboxylesterase
MNAHHSTNQSRFSTYRPDVLPSVVVRYLDAQQRTHGREAVADAFADDARVIDVETEHRGRDAVTTWLAGEGTEYTYTTSILGQANPGDGPSAVLVRLEGDFPGGVADLQFAFRVEDGLIAELVISVAPAHAPADAADASERATVVLVHGAFAESSSWDGVVDRLLEDGLPVIAVANPLRGLAFDAAYLRSVLDSIEGPVVIAGHSYGGTVMSEAAEGARNVRALVYVASFALDVGESTGELAGKYPGGELGAALESVPFSTGGAVSGSDLSITQTKFHGVFAADVPEAVATRMAVTQRPIAAQALEDTATKAAWKSIPSWSLVTLQDLAIPADSMRFMAARAASHTVEIDASHAVTVSQPDAVAALILEAVRETGGPDGTPWTAIAVAATR